MKALIVAELLGDQLAPQCLNVVTAAKACCPVIDILVVGNKPDLAAAEASQLPSVNAVLCVNSHAAHAGSPEHIAALVAVIGKSYSHILFAATSAGKASAPRAAALLDVPQVSDIVKVVTPQTFERPIFAGNAIETVEVTAAPRIITVRPTAFAGCERTGKARIESLEDVAVSASSVVVERKASTSGRPDLGSARVVVSGGRALGSSEKFNSLLTPLADRLGAALGASRAAVDAGYAPNNWQVGQTGRIVAPDLYFACGISGAIQHLAGMKDSKVIVAINTDPEAPIFQIADYGLVGDIFEVVPAVVERLS